MGWYQNFREFHNLPTLELYNYAIQRQIMMPKGWIDTIYIFPWSCSGETDNEVNISWNFSKFVFLIVFSFWFVPKINE